MKITNLEETRKTEVKMEGAEGASKQVPVGKEDGVPVFSTRVFTLAPGGHTPFHTHPFEHVNYVISGEGELNSEEGPKKIKAGDFMFVNPNEKHQYRNPSDSELVFMCMVPKEYE